jgi:hypothetical protein
MTGQLSLLEWSPPLPPVHMAGDTYDINRDFFRLNNLLRNFRDVMLNAGYLSMAEVKRRMFLKTGKEYGDASLRARHNQFRNHPALKDHYIAESRCEKGGHWLYSLRAR